MVQPMVRDITYCSNDDCPFTDCIRHLSQLKGEKESVIISLANFGGVCRKYLYHLIGECELPFEDDTYLTEEIQEE